jgi:adenylyltransferase/sulfurtransferase
VGSLQATEILKELLGIGDSLSGSLLVYDALATQFRTIKVKRDPGCPLCGETPTITDLSIHQNPEAEAEDG